MRAGSGAESSRACSGGRSLSLVVTSAVLVALALPALDLRTGSAGVRTIPDGVSLEGGFNALEREFGVGTVDSAEVVVEGDTTDEPRREAVDDPARSACERPGVPLARDVTIGPNEDIAVVEAQVAGDSRDEAAVQAIERLRTDLVPEALGGTDACGLSSPARRPRSSTTAS